MTLEQTMQHLQDAMLKGDLSQVSHLLSPEFTFIDALGRSFDAETYLDHYVDPANIRWLSRTDDFSYIDHFEDTAIQYSLTEDRFEYGTTQYVGRFRIVSIYRATSDGWKWHFGQLTSLDPS
ncbi:MULTISPECIES: nuclear transport factor 2 family protein [Exiguobacterium]|uniref:Nuclear transport factor 2 family protein n=1 Tax=Exiguobacterium indicum TaxID=296995 RepID=A0A0V8GKM8_9BACL|nr:MULTISPECIES: nuclear transport factor 2 family protein [Exiguobacterium]AHA31471.1 hypothetical protein U719_09635 [Exiguobacterium sp. MH3]KSU50820.1 hypothetical protein AS033_05425 [Exiguobacterium enclense]MCQ4090077.1 nuclear transport factor 2 family protein [Exiguobacterium sp. LL15]MDT0172213.1 nuclear transport factor 2 family protein [Exiguobacterium sp. BRG2]NTY09737.1 nuclear transport factor 2 family protein [Exiguobacterium sp. JMULE1]